MSTSLSSVSSPRAYEPNTHAFNTGWLCNGRELSFGREMLGLAVDGPWIPAARFVFCGSACELSNVPVQLEAHAAEGLDGNLGADAFRRFRRVVFNPDKLYLQLIPAESN